MRWTQWQCRRRQACFAIRCVCVRAWLPGCLPKAASPGAARIANCCAVLCCAVLCCAAAQGDEAQGNEPHAQGWLHRQAQRRQGARQRRRRQGQAQRGRQGQWRRQGARQEVKCGSRIGDCTLFAAGAIAVALNGVHHVWYACMLLRSPLGLLLALAAAHLAWQAGAVRAPPVGGSTPTSAALGVPLPPHCPPPSSPGGHDVLSSRLALTRSGNPSSLPRLGQQCMPAVDCRDASLAAECKSSKLAPCAAFHRVLVVHRPSLPVLRTGAPGDPARLCMPVVRHGETCDCCAPAPASQSLAEVAFAMSASAAAQAGDYFRVQQLVTRNPAALHDDGSGGECRPTSNTKG